MAKKALPSMLHIPVGNIYDTGLDGAKITYKSKKYTNSSSKIRCHGDSEVILQQNSKMNVDSKLILGGRFRNFPVSTTVISIRDEGLLHVSGEKKTSFKTGCHIDIRGGEFNIGDSHLNPYSRIICENNVTIGDGCDISWNVEILDSNLHELWVAGEKVKTGGDVVIEDGVWIGHDVSILKGVTVGENSVIGANSVVTTDVPSDSVVAGNPAEVIYTNTKHS